MSFLVVRIYTTKRPPRMPLGGTLFEIPLLEVPRENKAEEAKRVLDHAIDNLWVRINKALDDPEIESIFIDGPYK